MSYRKQSIKKNRKGLNSKRQIAFECDAVMDEYYDFKYWEDYLWWEELAWYEVDSNPKNMREYHMCKFTLTLQNMDVQGARQYHYDRAW